MATSSRGTVQERSDRLRERVRDHLARQGGPRRHEDAKSDFVEHAIRVGRQYGMRLWNDTTRSMEAPALSSLDVLLEERTNTYRTSDGKMHHTTGRNVNWVLDLWEKALDVYRDPLSREPTPDPSDEQLGVEPFAASAPAATVRQPRSLALRLMEAYIARNDDTFLAAVSEVEEAEGQTAASEAPR